MAKIEEKKQVVEELEKKLRESKAAVFANYRGINVADATGLRKSFREAGAEFRVVKNTLTLRAARQCGIEGLEQILEGPTAVAFGYHDPVTPAKLLINFSKTNRNIEIKGGIVEGRVVGFNEIKFLADLPSREVLLSQMLRGMVGPLAGLGSVLQGPLRKLVYALKAIQEQKAAG